MVVELSYELIVRQCFAHLHDADDSGVNLVLTVLKHTLRCAHILLLLHSTHIHMVITTSNVTGRHRGPKQKLRAGYRAPSLERTSRCDAFSSSSVLSCALSVLCVYSKFGHHPHPLGYLCAKIRFFPTSTAQLAQGEKLRTESITQLI